MTPRSWLRWSAITIATWAGLWLLATGLGSKVDLVLLLTTVATLVLAIGVLVEVNIATEEVDWTPPHRSGVRSYGIDPRFSRLSRSFTDGTDSQRLAEQIHTTLTGVVDARLTSKYGVDRQQHPARARSILGDQLADYVDRPPRHRRGMVDRISAIVTRIEAL